MFVKFSSLPVFNMYIVCRVLGELDKGHRQQWWKLCGSTLEPWYSLYLLKVSKERDTNFKGLLKLIVFPMGKGFRSLKFQHSPPLWNDSIGKGEYYRMSRAAAEMDHNLTSTFLWSRLLLIILSKECKIPILLKYLCLNFCLKFFY